MSVEERLKAFCKIYDMNNVHNKMLVAHVAQEYGLLQSLPRDTVDAYETFQLQVKYLKDFLQRKDIIVQLAVEDCNVRKIFSFDTVRLKEYDYKKLGDNKLLIEDGADSRDIIILATDRETGKLLTVKWKEVSK